MQNQDSQNSRRLIFTDREIARQEIRRSWRQIISGLLPPALTRVNGETSYICPLCGHGTHGDGLTVNPKSIDGNRLKCFGCGWSGDIIDLYRQFTGADYNTALSLLAKEIGVTIQDFNEHSKNKAVNAPNFNFYTNGNVNSYLESKASKIAQKTQKKHIVKFTTLKAKKLNPDSSYLGPESPAASGREVTGYARVGNLKSCLTQHLNLSAGCLAPHRGLRKKDPGKRNQRQEIENLPSETRLLTPDCRNIHFSHLNASTGVFYTGGSINPYPEQKTPKIAQKMQKKHIAKFTTLKAKKLNPNASLLTHNTSVDFSAYYQECQERLNDPAATAYLTARGISHATAAAYRLGFDPIADPANNPGGTGTTKHPCPRIIIPVSSGHYVGRSIDPTTDKRYTKLNPPGAISIFNGNVLYAQNVQKIFVVEGVFDALSIIEVGADAIALNSISNAKKLIELLEKNVTSATLILCLDNDGNTATAAALQTLQDGLTRLNISHITDDVCGNYKDPNEHLIGNKTAFLAAIENAKYKASSKPDNVANYIDHFMTTDIDRFKSDIKTGYNNLDEKCGGLYSGLYAIAAISSLGKTTFALQMADQIAAGGNDVLFFSLEQSRLELVSKSITRITAQQNPQNAVNSLSIRNGYLPPQVLAATQAYKRQVSDRMSIIEGNFNCNISFIGNYIRQYIHRTGNRPVVFIDYLQILQSEPEQSKQTVKEVVDNTVTQLKRISREYNLTIFIISSVNRSNYLTPIDFESLKESGSIEYTCDVVWGLQLQCLNQDEFDKQNNTKRRREIIKEAKAANPRKIELVCLKNRYGVATFSCYFDYFPTNDLFKEGNETELDFSIPIKKAGRKL